MVLLFYISKCKKTNNIIIVKKVFLMTKTFKFSSFFSINSMLASTVKKAEKSLQKRYELEKLINRISKKFVNASTDQIDDVFESDIKLDYCVTPDKVYKFQ